MILASLSFSYANLKQSKSRAHCWTGERDRESEKKSHTQKPVLHMNSRIETTITSTTPACSEATWCNFKADLLKCAPKEFSHSSFYLQHPEHFHFLIYYYDSLICVFWLRSRAPEHHHIAHTHILTAMKIKKIFSHSLSLSTFWM